MSESIEKKAAAASNCGNEELNAAEAAQTQGNEGGQEKPARQGTRRAGDNFLDVIYKFETSYPGGITADNAAHAVETVCPAGLDICSGVEKQPGLKDHQKITEIINRIRRADRIQEEIHEKYSL